MQTSLSGGGGRARVNAVKVFSATRPSDRRVLGEVMTSWLQQHRTIVIADIVVQQSSDRDFHCLSVTFLYWQPLEDVQSPSPGQLRGHP